VSTYKLVLFDLDGTLLDTAPALIKAANRLLKKYQHPEREYEALRSFASNGAIALIKQAFNKAPLPADINILREEFLIFYQQDILYGSNLFPGVDKLLSTLEKQNISWGIVTNKPRFLSEYILSLLKLTERCAVLKCGDDMQLAKPAPDLLLSASKKIAVTAQECIYIGDHLRDIQAGNAADMFTVAVSYGYIQADTNIKSWQANCIVDSVSQLEQLLST
jgi:2-phosphoglycolate phosphatase